MKKKLLNNPPKIAEWCINRLLPDDRQTPVGDFEEYYHRIAARDGKSKAHLWYYTQVIKLLPKVCLNNLYWKIAMFGNYLKLTFRNFRKNKINSLINTIGLSLGISCCILVMLFVQNEYGYDRFHENVDRIYDLHGTINFGFGRAEVGAQPSLGPTLPVEFPEVEDAVRVNKETFVLEYENLLFEENGLAVDPTFFNIFTFPLKYGKKDEVLNDLHDIVISEEMSTKCFDYENPVGKSITVKVNDKEVEFLVSGVTRAYPENSSLVFDFLVPIGSVYNEKTHGWNEGVHVPTFLLLRDGANASELEAKFPETIDSYFKEKFGEKSGYMIQAFSDYHLRGLRNSSALVNKSSAIYVYILSVIAILVLLIACFNFTNLSVAGASNRFVEIGVRKVVGAQEKQLINQFWSEAAIISLISLIIGIFLAYAFIPYFNHLSARHLSMFNLWNPYMILGLIALLFFVSSAAGGYPSLVLSKLKMLDLFKRKYKISGKNTFGKALIVIQFTISICLIVASIFIYRQHNFLMSKDLGFVGEQVVIVPLHNVSEDLKSNDAFFETFKNRLLSHSAVKSVSGSEYTMVKYWMSTVLKPLGEEQAVIVDVNSVDYDYITTLGMQLTEGRNLSRDYPSDSDKAVIVNETFIQRLRVENPIGVHFDSIFEDNNRYKFTIVGILKDYHHISLRESIRPTILRLSAQEDINYVYIKISADRMHETIKIIEREFNTIICDAPFSFSFLDERVAQRYQMESRWSRIVTYASAMAIILACSGLFGLTLLTVVRRTKEIGIRKVLGASAANIIDLIHREFSLLLIIANVVAWPLTYFSARAFLENYAYRINLDLWVFIAGSLTAILISEATICVIAFRAAWEEPVKSIRYE